MSALSILGPEVLDHRAALGSISTKLALYDRILEPLLAQRRTQLDQRAAQRMASRFHAARGELCSWDERLTTSAGAHRYDARKSLDDSVRTLLRMRDDVGATDIALRNRIEAEAHRLIAAAAA